MLTSMNSRLVAPAARSLLRPTTRNMAAIKKSQAIEDWGKMRESTVEPFLMTPKNALLSFIFGLLVPAALLKGVLGAQHARDAEVGKPRKDYVGDF
ncbi:hypothetical protein SARC_10194 [Sphaeroforma arctica JP610]|uniref:Uncharacterized protein n=1 Tax=Sphaeroforma arctica JP610 TaxID=667725 RepID=A0A0L0FKP7_9EUKA|nr:hypothetical protein SARC_10194 [Sphaeroforma arctica JP610]KNC77345.1 hypothetical protein SARC_10194 [Sphaeroforma arctica JP610]|eukprot:XP_014151247.1 hypothetical protein SARC_10194 [Sphaeroforma arctica JP610]